MTKNKTSPDSGYFLQINSIMYRSTIRTDERLGLIRQRNSKAGLEGIEV